MTEPQAVPVVAPPGEDASFEDHERYEVRREAGQVIAPPAPEEPPEEPAAAPAQAPDPDRSSADTTTTAGRERNRRGRFSSSKHAAGAEDVPRIRELSGQVSAAEARAAAAEKDRDEARAELASRAERAAETAPPPPTAQQPTRGAYAEYWKQLKNHPLAPKIEEFDNYEDYSAAVSLFVSDVISHQRLEALREEQSQAQARTEYGRVVHDSMRQAEADYPDFDRLANEHADLPVSELMHQVFNGPARAKLPAIYYGLVTHPEEAREIARLTDPTEVAYRLASLAADGSPVSRNPAARTGSAVAPPVSTPPRPIKPVRTVAMQADDLPPPASASFEEHEAYEIRQEAKRRASR